MLVLVSQACPVSCMATDAPESGSDGTTSPRCGLCQVLGVGPARAADTGITVDRVLFLGPAGRGGTRSTRSLASQVPYPPAHFLAGTFSIKGVVMCGVGGGFSFGSFWGVGFLCCGVGTR